MTKAKSNWSRKRLLVEKLRRVSSFEMAVI
jgi:hypothetical protein